MSRGLLVQICICKRATAVPCVLFIYIYSGVYKIIIWFQGFGQELFFVSAQVCDSRNWNSRSNSYVRAPPSGGGSNAPRPAVSVPHINVNADRCRVRQARSCKNTACRGGISEIWLNYNVCSAWMIYKIGIVSKKNLITFGILRWHTLERLFLCCTFLQVRLVSCSAFIVLLLLVSPVVSCPFSCFLQKWVFCAANTILNFFAIYSSFLSSKLNFLQTQFFSVSSPIT